jgi:hypothetical protein
MKPGADSKEVSTETETDDWGGLARSSIRFDIGGASSLLTNLLLRGTRGVSALDVVVSASGPALDAVSAKSCWK